MTTPFQILQFAYLALSYGRQSVALEADLVNAAKLPESQSVILDSINEGVFTVDLEWRVTAFNQAAERITGIDRQDALGGPGCEVFRASIRESACVLRRTLTTGKPIVNATAHIVSDTGQLIPIRISIALLKDAGGAVIGGVETFQDLSQIVQLKKELEARYTFEDTVGRSPAMTSLFQVLPQIAETDSTVQIEGASGTGKELFARAIHNLSRRKKKRFMAINCAALPDTLLESGLFGHKAGAFTDARKDKPGRFALADGGTIFLDEIGDISQAMQVRLLRVLQERSIEPLGFARVSRSEPIAGQRHRRRVERSSRPAHGARVSGQRSRTREYHRAGLCALPRRGNRTPPPAARATCRSRSLRRRGR
ncbi:MAG: sigma 54-interacting transcriptional regulator [Phycisphaerae bacterium]|nr:sigma 54-interacting transcriptional regulator [Phycisphaerae bacterium]